MRIGKVVLVVFAVIGTLALLAVGIVALRMFVPSRDDQQQNFAPADGQKTSSSADGTTISSRTQGQSSFLYRRAARSTVEQRLTSVSAGYESEPTFSHDGKLVAYTFARTPESKSSIWLVGVNGSIPHQVTGENEDALHPVFSPDDFRLFYAVSARTGNNSPIVRPARHDWDVYSLPVSTDPIKGVTPLRHTDRSFYDLKSLDTAAVDGVPADVRILIITTEYPIGDVIEEFNLVAKSRSKVFQPRVPGVPVIGPSFGEAYFTNAGMDVLFLAATNTSGGNYDYNVFSMSDVTGGEIKQLTHLSGMTKELKRFPNGMVTVVNSGRTFAVNLSSGAVRPPL